MRRQEPLQRVLLATHAVLLAAAATAVGTADLALATRAVLLLAVLAPLAPGLPGLYAGRRSTYPWTALAVVLFAGASAAEVVATLGGSLLAGVVLLASLLELGLLFVLSRRPSG